jgi:hypothetical protein
LANPIGVSLGFSDLATQIAAIVHSAGSNSAAGSGRCVKLCWLGEEGSIRPDRYYLRYSVVYFFRGYSANMSRGSDGLESIWDATPSVSLVASHAFTLTERRLNAVLQSKICTRTAIGS